MARKRTSATNTNNSVHFTARSQAQTEAFKVYTENDIIFLLGPAGTGKTHVAVYCALYDMTAAIRTNRVDRIVLTRPLVEAGERLGFLPGDIDQKVDPFMLPVYDCVSKMVHNADEFIDQHFELAPLAYMRGRTFENCVAILDEAQNCTTQQLKLFMTRLGRGGKLIITGDLEQSDIGRRSGLRKIIDAMTDEPSIGVYKFSDEHIVRHPLVARVLARWPK